MILISIALQAMLILDQNISGSVELLDYNAMIMLALLQQCSTYWCLYKPPCTSLLDPVH